MTDDTRPKAAATYGVDLATLKAELRRRRPVAIPSGLSDVPDDVLEAEIARREAPDHYWRIPVWVCVPVQELGAATGAEAQDRCVDLAMAELPEGWIAESLFYLGVAPHVVVADDDAPERLWTRLYAPPAWIKTLYG